MRFKLQIGRAIALAAFAIAIGRCGGGGSSSSHTPFTVMYCTNAFSYDISQFKIAPNGALSTLTPNVRYTVNTNGLPGSESINFDPSHRHAYLANLGASTIDEFQVASDGSLVYFGTYTMDQGANASEPSIVVFSANGKYAYATSESRTNHKLTEFTVKPNGALALLG